MSKTVPNKFKKLVMNLKIKYKVSILSLIILALIQTTCIKDNDPIRESPFFNFFDLPDIHIDTVENAGVNWEYGFRFKPIKAGFIDKLGIKLPAVGTYKVKLYDVTFGQLLIAHEISSLAKNTERYISIDKLFVGPDNELGLAIVADVFFKIRNLNGTEIPFPQDIGNLRILSFNEDTCGVNGCLSFPLKSNSSIIAPCVNLTFTVDE